MPIEDDLTPAPAPLAPAVEPPAPAPAPAPAAPAPEPAAEVDDFAAAFAELNAPAEKAPAEPAKPIAPAAPAAPATPAAPAAPVVPATPAAPAVGELKPLTTPPAPAAAPEGFVSAADFAALKLQIAELSKPAAPAPAPAAPAPAPEIYTPDELKTIEKYREEWPDIAANEAAIRRGEYNELIRHIFSQISPVLDQALRSTQSLETRTQLTDLEELIPDYHQVRDAAVTWAHAQPGTLGASLKQVTAKGSPEDVAAMVDMFKKSTGWVNPNPPAAPAALPAAVTPPPVAPAAALPAAVAAAAAALRPVASKRGDPPAGQDPNDFDAAFKEFTAEAK